MFFWNCLAFSVIQRMLLKCCTQYASKFGKLSSDHRTGKGQFSLQSQRREMPKNVQTTTQLHSFHMLVRLCSKSFKIGFSSMWIENLQMYKLGLQNAEEPEIKLPTSIGSQRKQQCINVPFSPHPKGLLYLVLSHSVMSHSATS